jgi:tetraacyldisaccharide 4'-kinase
MKILRYLLFPFSIVYGLILRLRNLLFDTGILPSYTPDIPLICLGNLSLGGTGKSPHTEYLVKLLQPEHTLAVLSRGYGRKTSGFRYVQANDLAENTGDEPLQFKQKFGNALIVAVAEKRKEGIQRLCAENPELNLILLDDAYQHRQVKAQVNILLTEYAHPYFKDCLLPAGNLREPRAGAARADAVIVTKCPDDLTEKEMDYFRKHLSGKEVFFSKIVYSALRSLQDNSELPFPGKDAELVLLTGIANSKPLEAYLQTRVSKLQCLEFPDHHAFSVADVGKLSRLFEPMSEKNNIIVTTEKDAMRLRHPDISKLTRNLPIYYVPIHIEFCSADSSRFQNFIRTHVSKNQERS